MTITLVSHTDNEDCNHCADWQGDLLVPTLESTLGIDDPARPDVLRCPFCDTTFVISKL